MDPRLLDYIKDTLDDGVPADQIKQNLLDKGWEKETVEEAFSYINPHLPGPTELFRAAWKIYKSRWRAFIGIMLLPVIFNLITGTFSIFFFNSDAATLARFANFFSSPTNAILFLAAVLIYFVLFTLINIWSQIALIYTADKYNQNIHPKTALISAAHKITSYFWVSFLGAIITLGGYLFFFIPGVAMSIWFSLAFFIVVLEKERGFTALLKSREYVRNFWWSIWWRFLALSFIFTMIIALILLILMIFILPLLIFVVKTDIGTSILSPERLAAVVPVLSQIRNIFESLVSLITVPLTLIYTYLIYKNLRTIKKLPAPFTPPRRTKLALLAPGILGLLFSLAVVFFLIYITGQTVKNLPASQPIIPDTIPNINNINSNLNYGNKAYSVINLKLDKQNSQFTYSFLPDRTGILYIENLRESGGYQPETYLFKYLDFSVKKPLEIHRINFHKDYIGEFPYVLWLDNQNAMLGAKIYLGLCDPYTPSSAVLYNKTQQTTLPVECITRGRLEANSDFNQRFAEFHMDYLKNKKQYTVYKVSYAAQYSNSAYILINKNSTKHYLLSNYTDNRVTEAEKIVYKELDNAAKSILKNTKIQTGDMPPDIRLTTEKFFSPDNQFYFMRVLEDTYGCAVVDCLQTEYLQIFNKKSDLVRKIKLGEVGMLTPQVSQLGYVGFWNNNNQVVIIKDFAPNEYQILFFSPYTAKY